MNLLATFKTASTVVAISAAMALPAQATTRVVEFNLLTASGTINTPFLFGDTLILDTLVTMEAGALTQIITFTVGAGVTALIGQAAWEISTAAGPGPRLVSVNIDIFNAGNNLVTSDTNVVVANRFATSSFASAIGPGTYTLKATGNAVRDASLDVAISFVPEPSTYGMLLAGLGVVALLARRRPD